MSSISEILQNQSPPTTEPKTFGGALGKEDFLRLLVAQLEHQDPLNPSDPTEFTGQLAQFSTLEQLFNVNETLGEMNSGNAALEKLSALSMLGKEIVSESSDFRLEEGEPVKLGYKLEDSADEIQIYVRDEFNRTVASLSADSVGPGEHFLQWDSLDDNGQVAPPGDYKLVVSALRGKDEPVAVSPLIGGVVTGIDLDEQGNMLITNTGEFPLDTIKSVRYL